MCASIVGYFSYSSWIVVIYGIITFTILIESIDNQKKICLLPDDYDLKGDINKLCEQRLLFNFTSVSSDFRRHNINIHFTTDSNYFIVPCLYGFHISVILGTTAISPHLLPISFHLLNKKPGAYFKEWDLINYDVVYYIFIKKKRVKKVNILSKIAPNGTLLEKAIKE